MSKKADQLWLRMIEMYGTKWINSYGSEPSELWITLCDSLHGYQLRHAIKCFFNDDSDFVPTLGKFKKTAKAAPKPPNHDNLKITQDKERFSEEVKEKNKKKLKSIVDGVLSGKFKGMSYEEIEKKIGEENEK